MLFHSLLSCTRTTATAADTAAATAADTAATTATATATATSQPAEVGLERKFVLSVIGAAVKKFKSAEVVKETLRALLEDEVPALALMRTAVAACYDLPGHKDELKSFVFSEVIPKLVRKKIWILSPPVWDGVAFGLKKLGSHNDAEPTLRALLGLPAAQLKALLRIADIAKNIKGPMKVYLYVYLLYIDKAAARVL